MSGFLRVKKRSEGNADRSFFQDIYKTGGGSGSCLVNGWIVKFLPYTKDRKGAAVRNRVLSGDTRGVETSELPSGISNVPFLFDLAPYQFIGGHTAVCQEADGTVRPALGWAVRPDPKSAAGQVAGSAAITADDEFLPD